MIFKNNFYFYLFFIILLFSSFVYSTSISEETATVSRLIGEEPEDIINQLDTEEIDLTHANYYGFKPDIEQQFYLEKGVNNYFNLSSITYNRDWDLEDLEEIKPKGVTSGGKFLVIGDLYEEDFAEEVKFSEEDFSSTYPLSVISSSHLGYQLPTQNDYDFKSVERYMNLILPTFSSSDDYIKSLFCNLDNTNLGNIIRSSRNSYYQNINPSPENILGVILNSYHLFGNPLTTYSFPMKIDEYDICNDLRSPERKDFDAQYYPLEFQKVKYNLEENYNFSIGNISNKEYIYIEGKENNLITDYGEIVSPFDLKFTTIPKKSIVKNLTYKFSNPINYTINLSSFDGNNLTNSFCYIENSSAFVESDLSSGQEKSKIKFVISPLEINNCSSGKITAYKNVKISYDLETSVPTIFELEHKNMIAGPNQNFNIVFNFDKVLYHDFDGEISLYLDDKIVNDFEFIQSPENLTLVGTSPKEYGTYKYDIEFKASNQTIQESEFVLEVKPFDFNIVLPKNTSKSGSTELDLNFVSLIPEENSIDLRLYVEDSFETGDSFQLNSLSEISKTYSFDPISGDEEFANIKFIISDKNNFYVYNNILRNNFRPEIFLEQDYYEVVEGEEVRVKVFMDDKDDLEILDLEINDSRFEKKSYEYFVWKTEKGDNGIYNFEISVDDGFLNSSLEFRVKVLKDEEKKRELNLLNLKNRYVNRGDVVRVVLKVDNEEYFEDLFYSVSDPRFEKVEENVFEWVVSGSYGHSFIFSVENRDTGEIDSESMIVYITNTPNKDYDISIDAKNYYEKTLNGEYFIAKMPLNYEGDGDLDFDTNTIGAFYDFKTESFLWLPSKDDLGSNNITLEIYDSYGNSDLVNFIVEVKDISEVDVGINGFLVRNLNTGENYLPSEEVYVVSKSDSLQFTSIVENLAGLSLYDLNWEFDYKDNKISNSISELEGYEKTPMAYNFNFESLGIKEVAFHIDSEDKYLELNESNNLAKIKFEVKE